MKSLKWLISALVLIGLLLLIAVLSRMLAAHAPIEIGYADLVTIVLTALSIMITVLGLGLAVLGVIGYATFEAKLRDHSFSYFAAELGKDGKLRREIEALIIETSLKGVESLEQPPREGNQKLTNDDKDGDYVD